MLKEFGSLWHKAQPKPTINHSQGSKESSGQVSCRSVQICGSKRDTDRQIDRNRVGQSYFDVTDKKHSENADTSTSVTFDPNV